MITPPIAIAASLPQPKEVDATTTIENAAHRYGIDAVKFFKVAECEDPGLVPDKQSEFVRKDGTREPSYGVFMIDQEYHPEIPIASSTNVAWASDWAANQWSLGHEHSWSCYAIEQAKDWQ